MNTERFKNILSNAEREFCRDECGLDPHTEVSRISQMYLDVKGDVEANTPDGFVSVAEIVKRKPAGNVVPGTMAFGSTSAGAIYNAFQLQFQASNSVSMT